MKRFSVLPLLWATLSGANAQELGSIVRISGQCITQLESESFWKTLTVAKPHVMAGQRIRCTRESIIILKLPGNGVETSVRLAESEVYIVPMGRSLPNVPERTRGGVNVEG